MSNGLADYVRLYQGAQNLLNCDLEAMCTQHISAIISIYQIILTFIYNHQGLSSIISNDLIRDSQY